MENDLQQLDPQQLIDAYLDETLTPEQGAALNAWVKESSENARRFAKSAWLHRQVYDQLHVRDLQQIQDDHSDATDVDYGDVLQQLLAIEQGAGDSGMVDLTEEMKRRGLAQRREKARRAAMSRRGERPGEHGVARAVVIPKALAYSVAAAVAFGLIFAGYAGWLGGKQSATPTLVEQQDADTAGQSLPPVVAHLVGGRGVRWANHTRSTRPGTPLRKGMLQLDAGIAEVRFESGAVATFRGPALIDLRGDNRMALIEGAMVANVPKDAYGFTVDTPTMRVVDLGTEFAMTADAAGDSAVQVFAGEVTAAAFDTQGHLGEAGSVKSRDGLAIDADTRVARTIEVDGRAFEDLAPHVALLYRNLVVNGDFEQGEPGHVTGATLHDVENIRVPGWEDTGPGTLLPYEAASAFDYPNPALHPMPDDHGQAFYAGMAEGSIRQRVDVSGLAGLIDAGQVAFDLSAWLGGYAEQDEYLVLTAHFMDERGRRVGRPAALDPVHVYDRDGESGFVLRESHGQVPARTRSIEIVIENVGHHTPPYVRDGYADNVALSLSVVPD
ncbi:FecR domain-containing protein [Phycisphaeraceae bacterium D3-23]